MERFYYRNLDVYKNSKQLVIEIYEITKSFPREELYGLSDQLKRASVSVISNIAEGFGRFSTKERLYFLGNSSGSLMEVSSQIDIAEAIGFIDCDTKEKIDNEIEIIIKQLVGLRNAIENKNK